MGNRDDIEIVQLPRPGEILEERYRLGKPFASGGMGIIMRAEQVRTGRTVAVKLLHPHIAAKSGFADRFQREVQVATLFDHQHIMRVYDVGQTDEGVLYLVMELLEGEELKDVIEAEAPMSVGRAGRIALQMLDGLAEAHAMGVVHRDFKPANVFVTQTRRGTDHVKLLDFGIAKVINAQEHEITLTGQITGTPAYLAPETLLRKDQRNQKVVDVYGAGLVLLEMLTGENTFQGEDMPQTLLLQIKKPVRIPEIIANTPLGEVIKRSTAKHPDDRYPDADAMYEALEVALEASPKKLRVEGSPGAVLAPRTSGSLLEKIATGDADTDLQILRDAPQYEAYSTEETDREKITVQTAAHSSQSAGAQLASTRAFEPSTSDTEPAQSRPSTIALNPDDVEIVADEEEARPTEEFEQPEPEDEGHIDDSTSQELIDSAFSESTGAGFEPTTDQFAMPASVEVAGATDQDRRSSRTSIDEVPPPQSTQARDRAGRRAGLVSASLVASDDDAGFSRRTAILTAGAVALAVVGAIAAWWVNSDASSSESSTHAVPQSAPDSVQEEAADDREETQDALDAPREATKAVSFQLVTQPEEVDIVADGDVIGSTSEPLEISRGDLPRTITLSRDDFRNQTVTLDVGSPRTLDVQLEPIEPEPARKPKTERRRDTRPRSQRRAPRRQPKPAEVEEEPSRPKPPSEDIDQMVDEFLPDE